MKLKNVWKIGVGVLGICISMLFSNVNVVSANEADIMEELETADLQISTARELEEFSTKVNNENSNPEQQETPDTGHKHNLTHIEEKLATCTENGSKSYWYCSDCQKKYTEENAETEIQETEIIVPATNHQHTEIRNVKVVTCTENGYTGDTYCRDCNTLLISGQALATKGHIWNTGNVTKQPLAAIKGKKTYTCTECGKTKTESIPATGAHKKGTILKKGNNVYKVTKKGLKNGTVAFKGITGNIKNVKIPKAITVEGITYKVTSIEDKALYKNKTITNVSIGNNIKTVSVDIFRNCKSLKKISADKETIFTTKQYKYNITGASTVSFAGLNDKNLEKISIPQTVKIGKKVYKVTAIAENAFKNNKKITDVTIKSNIKKIGKSAFEGCTNLVKVMFGSKIEIIGEKAFKGCSKVTNITFGSSVKKIEKQAFMGCKSITDITIPKNVKIVGDEAFKNCKNLSKVTAYFTKKAYYESSKSWKEEQEREHNFSISILPSSRWGKNIFLNIKEEASMQAVIEGIVPPKLTETAEEIEEYLYNKYVNFDGFSDAAKTAIDAGYYHVVPIRNGVGGKGYGVIVQERQVADKGSSWSFDLLYFFLNARGYEGRNESGGFLLDGLFDKYDIFFTAAWSYRKKIDMSDMANWD